MREFQLAKSFEDSAVLRHALFKKAGSLLRCTRVVEDHIQVSDARLCALRQEAAQVARTNVQLNVKVLIRTVGALLQELGTLLVRAHVVFPLLLLKYFKHCHVLFDEACISATQLPDQAQSPSAIGDELENVEDKHAVPANEERQAALSDHDLVLGNCFELLCSRTRTRLSFDHLHVYFNSDSNRDLFI